MANARLHLICGNCGCNDMFSFEIVKDGIDMTPKMFDAVFISCGNCATLHSLDDTIKDKNIEKYLKEQG